MTRNMIETRANMLAATIQRRFPEAIAWVSLDTIEGEDAYLWIKVPREQVEDVLYAASDLTVEPLIEEGIFIVPRVAPRDGVRAE